MTSDAPAAEQTDTLTAGAIPSGSGFRAVLRRGDEIVWRCQHVHFTDHSAKACASGELARIEKPAASASEAAG